MWWPLIAHILQVEMVQCYCCLLYSWHYICTSHYNKLDTGSVCTWCALICLGCLLCRSWVLLSGHVLPTQVSLAYSWTVHWPAVLLTMLAPLTHGPTLSADKIMSKWRLTMTADSDGSCVEALIRQWQVWLWRSANDVSHCQWLPVHQYNGGLVHPNMNDNTSVISQTACTPIRWWPRPSTHEWQHLCHLADTLHQLRNLEHAWKH